MAESKASLCTGCRDNFYNGNNDLGVTQCWKFKTAKIVTRFRLGWHTAPTSADVFTKVRTLDCHHEPGRFAYMKELPSHLVPLRRARKARSAV